MILLFISWFPPLELKGELPSFDESYTELEKDSPTFLVLMEEHKKVTQEIKMRQEWEDDWFHNKFLLAGILILGFVAYVLMPFEWESLKPGNKPNPQTRLISDGVYLKPELIFNTPTCLTLALACAISLIIDIHIRTHISAAAQAGLWIKYHVEDTFLGSNKCYPELKGWETFLRNSCENEHNGEGCKKGMNTDAFYRFLWPHLHVLTWLIYIIYMTLLFRVWRESKIDEGKISKSKINERKKILGFGFFLVHFPIVMFAWVGHTFPSMFESQSWPWGEFGDGAEGYYIMLSVVLIVINLFYLNPRWIIEKLAKLAKVNE
uniref:Uncharacterized protein n=1 Tax=Candidatus Kentrum sp. LPFa TaxID=2126335 RepID=A0A450XHA0_9GAMM|nr:MAG: hypothetical protein BECKLPF1236A_GA0070988_1001113 [Candidatus Kentron sp. LPFa]VFK28687.1 MAG: hypothetical protein BECKLPF1236C_GA0070990_1007112 [Candidatus Kentron sp. LPFa]